MFIEKIFDSKSKTLIIKLIISLNNSKLNNIQYSNEYQII